MSTLTERGLQKARWQTAFEHEEPGLKFMVLTNDIVPELTMTRMTRDGRRSRYFRVFGKRYDTLAQVVRGYNAEKDRRSGRFAAAGSVESLRLINGKMH